MYPEQEVDMACEYLLKNSISLDSKNIFITGASGFVGSWLLNVTHKLQRDYGQNFKVIATTRDVKRTQHLLGDEIFQHAQWVSGRIQDMDLERFDFSHVVHAATPTTTQTGSGDFREVRNTCVGGLVNILNACESRSSKVRVLHTSSGAVYQGATDQFGRSDLNFLIRKERNANYTRYPNYLETKLTAENILDNATAQQTISGANVRLFAFYGSGLPIDSHYAIGNFMRDGISNKTIDIKGTGRAIRSYLAGNRMAASILYALISEEESPFHIGSSVGSSLVEWAEQVATIFNKKVHVRNEFDDSEDVYIAGVDPKIPAFENQDPQSDLLKWKEFLLN